MTINITGIYVDEPAAQKPNPIDQFWTAASATPHWKVEHLQRLHDWCSSHEKHSTTIEAQLEFVAYELLNSFQAVGAFLKRAKTVEEAREAVQPYVRRLSAAS